MTLKVNPYTRYFVKTDIVFDPDRLASDLEYANKMWPATDEWPRIFLNLRKPSNKNDADGMKHGSVNPNRFWFYDENDQLAFSQQDYDTYCDWVKSLYTYQVITEVEKMINETYKLHVGRTRFVDLNPNVCLHLHADSDSDLRFHIPIITNDKCFYVMEDQVFRFKDPGRLYILNINKVHTVVNGSDQVRTHLLWDAYPIV